MTSQNFHSHAITWLRDNLRFEPTTLTNTVVSHAKDPSRAEVDGSTTTISATSPGVGAVMALFSVAGIAAMVAGRGGLSPATVSTASAVGFAAAIAGVMVWILYAHRVGRSRRPVHVVVLARHNTRQSALKLADVESLVGGKPHAVWIVSELGFDADGLARLRVLGSRAFTGQDARIVELAPPQAEPAAHAGADHRQRGPDLLVAARPPM